MLPVETRSCFHPIATDRSGAEPWLPQQSVTSFLVRSHLGRWRPPRATAFHVVCISSGWQSGKARRATCIKASASTTSLHPQLATELYQTTGEPNRRHGLIPEPDPRLPNRPLESAPVLIYQHRVTNPIIPTTTLLHPPTSPTHLSIKMVKAIESTDEFKQLVSTPRVGTDMERRQRGAGAVRSPRAHRCALSPSAHVGRPRL
jgi:hypothetical protein